MIKSLTIYIILASLMINLTPNMSFKKHIRFYTGLVLIVLLFDPFIKIIRFNPASLVQTVKEVSELTWESGYDSDIKDYYGMSLNLAIEEVLEDNNYTVHKMNVCTNSEHEVVRCELYITGEGGTDARDKIIDIIADDFGIRKDLICVVMV